MARPRLVPAKLPAIGRPARIAAAAGGVALVGLPVIGAVANRLRGDAAGTESLGPGLSGLLGLPELLADPAAAEAERAAQTAQKQTNAVTSGASGTDFGAGPASWSLDGVPDLLGLGGKVVAAGIDGAGEVAKLAGHGVRGLVDVASAAGGALPDLSAIAAAASAVGGAAGDILGAIGDGLGDLNF